MRVRFVFVLVAVALSLGIAAPAQAASVTITGPASGTQHYYLDPDLPVTATASTGGCAPGSVSVFIIDKRPDLPNPISIGFSFNTGHLSTGLGPSSLGSHEWWGRMTCPDPGHPGHVLTIESEHRTLIVTDQRAKPPVIKPPAKPKVTKQQKRTVLKKVIKTAKRTTTLSKKATAAQKRFSKQKTPAAQRSFGQRLQDIKDFLDLRDELKKAWDDAFPKPKQQTKKQFPTSVGAAGAGFRIGQLKAMPDYVKSLEKLGDFPNVAVRAADKAAAADPEVARQLDIAAGFFKAEHTWTMLTPDEKRKVALQSRIMIQTGAARTLVDEMNEAGKSASKVTFPQ